MTSKYLGTLLLSRNGKEGKEAETWSSFLVYVALPYSWIHRLLMPKQHIQAFFFFKISDELHFFFFFWKRDWREELETKMACLDSKILTSFSLACLVFVVTLILFNTWILILRGLYCLFSVFTLFTLFYPNLIFRSKGKLFNIVKLFFWKNFRIKLCRIRTNL